MPDIRNWSPTAADNDDAALTDGIDWRENQLARTVNNSARAEMAGVRGAVEGPDSKYNGVEYIDFGWTPTRTGNNTFTLPADYTTALVEGRRLRFTDASTIYGTMISSSFGAGVTTVTMAMDGASVLSASLTKVYLSPQMPTNPSAPVTFGKNQNVTTTGTSTAYVAAYSPRPTSLQDGMTVEVTLHTACGDNPTFTPDATLITPKLMLLPGALPIRTANLPALATLRMTYRSAQDRWLIHGVSAVVDNAVLARIQANAIFF